MMYEIGTVFVNPGDFEGRVNDALHDERFIDWTDEAGGEWYTLGEIECILQEYPRMYVKAVERFPEDLFKI